MALTHAARKAGLEALLQAHQGLWRPQPFKVETPDWCAKHPALTDELLALDDEAVERLQGDNLALIGQLARHVPELAELAALIDLPPSPARGRGVGGEGRLFTDIPGRKQAQIVAYAEALGVPRAPLIEWCAGKGHLGRLLAQQWQWPVASLEIDATLCAAGEALAERSGTACRQHFIAADALAPEAARHLAGRHAVALHACGDLHRALVTGAVAQASPALDFAPCCYYRSRDPIYRPLSGGQVELSHDDLRLAVTDTATASRLERQRSRLALAWKLGWVALRTALTGEPYRSFRPVPQAWLQTSFADFVRRMAAREGLALPPGLDPASYASAGLGRAERVRRLELVRLAFRRPLEVWLVMDMACFLAERDYAVRVGTFCPASVTPRNLLLSARKHRQAGRVPGQAGAQ